METTAYEIKYNKMGNKLKGSQQAIWKTQYKNSKDKICVQ